MTDFTTENTWVLPARLTHKAPLYKKGLWFDAVCVDFNVKRDYVDALVAEGIRERDCPSVAEWAAYVIAGGVIGALTNKFILPPKEPPPSDWPIQGLIWEALWQVSEEYRDKDALDKTFLAVMLQWFFPEQYHAPPERPYRMSFFERIWPQHYPDTMMQSVGNIRLKPLKEGREAMARLPESAADSIQKVAAYVPPLLEVAIRNIRRTYMW